MALIQDRLVPAHNRLHYHDRHVLLCEVHLVIFLILSALRDHYSLSYFLNKCLSLMVSATFYGFEIDLDRAPPRTVLLRKLPELALIRYWSSGVKVIFDLFIASERGDGGG